MITKISEEISAPHPRFLPSLPGLAQQVRQTQFNLGFRGVQDQEFINHIHQRLELDLRFLQVTNS
jgi:hypothetical protein